MKEFIGTLICLNCKNPFDVTPNMRERIIFGGRSCLCENCLDKLIDESTKDPNNPNRNDRFEKDMLKLTFLRYVKDQEVPKATELLTEFILNKLKIYTTKVDLKQESWVYKEGIYVPQGRSEVKELLRDILDEYYNQFYFNLVMVKIEVDTFIEPVKFFNNNIIEEIPVQNGVLNIFKRELSDFTPEKIFFSKLPIEYNPGINCDKIDVFLSEILSREEDRKVFYEIGAYCLLKENRFDKAFMFLGNGRNGKSTAIELLKRLVGKENTLALSLSAIKEGNADVHELFGKMLNIGMDISNTDLKETNFFKTLTTRDTISINRKFMNALSFVNHAKFVFACNELPKVYDTSRGFWERWLLIDFPYTFVDQQTFDSSQDKTNLKIKDPEMITKLTMSDEMSGFLNACLDGLEEIIENKKFSSTAGTEEIKNMWIRRSNSMIAFCESCIIGDYDAKINKKEFRKKYSDFCKLHKIKPLSDYKIKETLSNEYGVSDVREDYPSNDWLWVGIKWK